MNASLGAQPFSSERVVGNTVVWAGWLGGIGLDRDVVAGLLHDRLRCIDHADLKMHSENRFYVLLYPGVRDSVSNYLRNAGVELRDYAELCDPQPPKNQFTIEGDGHPLPRGTRWLPSDWRVILLIEPWIESLSRCRSDQVRPFSK